jgi:hypothetical protein
MTELKLTREIYDASHVAEAAKLYQTELSIEVTEVNEREIVIAFNGLTSAEPNGASVYGFLNHLLHLSVRSAILRS